MAKCVQYRPIQVPINGTQCNSDIVKKRKNLRADIDLIGTGTYGMDIKRDVLS